jgi:5-methylcytosine-specific restriction endonuclease McrA
MNSKQWEFPTGWPETKAQRETLRNALLERMLEWGGRNAKFSLPGHKQKPFKLLRLPGLRWPHQQKSYAEIRTNLRFSRRCPDRMPRRFIEAYGQWITKLHPQTQALIVRDGIKCHWCGRECSEENGRSCSGGLPPLFPTRDHLVRVRDNGSSQLHNLVLACHRCNTSRHVKGWKPQ